MRRLLASMVLPVAMVVAGCGRDSGPVSTSGRAPSVPRPNGDELQDELHVTCTSDATRVEARRVSARPDGLHVRVTDNGLGLTVYVTSPSAVRGWGHAATTRPGRVVEVHPGPVLVRCVDMESPEHSEPVAGSPEAQPVDVVAPPDGWRAPVALSCHGMRQEVTLDYQAPRDGKGLGQGDDPRQVVRSNGEVGRWLRPSDELSEAGYRDGVVKRVLVRRDGAVIASVALHRDVGGWYVTGFEACGDV